jgi:hypothetical protein
LVLVVQAVRLEQTTVLMEATQLFQTERLQLLEEEELVGKDLPLRLVTLYTPNRREVKRLVLA